MNKKNKKSHGNSKYPKKSKATNKTKPQKKKSFLNLYESKVLHVLKRDMEREFSSRELLRKTGLKDKDQFYTALKSLSEQEYIILRSHKVKFNDKPSEVRGEVFSLSRGFAFVRPEEGGDDIFVPGRYLKQALVGDTVLVYDIEKDSKGLCGKISRIIKEGGNLTTGTVSETKMGFELIPDNKLRYNPTITDLAGAKAGDKVMAKLKTDFRGDWSEAVVTKIFGKGSSAKVCSDAIIAQHNIPTTFPDEVLAEAKEISEQKISDEEISKRLDLRDKNIFTIDGEDAKDLDDAISLEKLENGWLLGVHIADVSHYIKGKTAVDNEAMERGTSVYFADRVIPMLPREISNGICSLTAGTDKLTFSAMIMLDENADIKKYDFKKTIINSKVRGVYAEVNKIFADEADENLTQKYSPVIEELYEAKKLADILKEKSKTRGNMEIDSGETRFVLNEDGVCVDLKPRTSGLAQELIEQFMITANICSAKFAQDKSLPFLYRVHEQPEPQNVRELVELLKVFSIPCKDLLKEKPNTADFANILEKVKGTKAESAISKKVLRTMEKAVYSTQPTGHFGLALKDYSHFTSPIRRYPDTSIHRVLSAYVEGMKSAEITKIYSAFCDKSATESSAHEIRAVRAERDAEDCYIAEYMAGHIGETFVGNVSSVLKTGVFVKLENSTEGFLSLANFPDKHFVFDGLITHRCTKTDYVLTIGTEIEVCIASAVVATGKVDFVIK